MHVDPCECLQRTLRAVIDGQAHCPKHRLFGTKIAGGLTADTMPPAGAMRPLTTREIAEQRAALRSGTQVSKRARIKAEALEARRRR